MKHPVLKHVFIIELLNFQTLEICGLLFAVTVTAVALVEHQFVEMESVQLSKEILILPRGFQRVQSQMDYFCLTGKVLEERLGGGGGKAQMLILYKSRRLN